jgi:methyl acetate hydrolase
MAGLLSRRDALLQGAGLAAAGLIPAAGVAAPARKPVQGDTIDAALQAKVTAKEIPGVVAMAANESSIVYQGAFGARNVAAQRRCRRIRSFASPRWSNC